MIDKLTLSDIWQSSGLWSLSWFAIGLRRIDFTPWRTLLIWLQSRLSLEPAAVTLYPLLNGSFTRLHVHRTCPETSPRSCNPRITEPLTQAAIENTFSRLCTLVAVVTRLRRLRL